VRPPAAQAAILACTIPRQRLTMFLFFSNKLGCLGSILVSVVLTLLVLLFFGVF
jgi:hypothetical protein